MRTLTLSPLVALALAPLACGGATPSARRRRTRPSSSTRSPGRSSTSTARRRPRPPAPCRRTRGRGGRAAAAAARGIRFIHASPDRGLASVSAFLDDSAVAAVQGLAYKAVAGYLEVTPGDHAVVLRRANAPAGAAPALSVRTDTLDPGARSTAIVYGLATGTPRLALAAGVDLLGLPEEGKARVRFFHALVGLGAVDVCRPPRRPPAPPRPTSPRRPRSPRARCSPTSRTAPSARCRGARTPTSPPARR